LLPCFSKLDAVLYKDLILKRIDAISAPIRPDCRQGGAGETGNVSLAPIFVSQPLMDETLLQQSAVRPCAPETLQP
jgi:hypothetical protein